MASANNQLTSVVKAVLLRHTEVPISHGDLVCRPAFDDERASYLLLVVGWQGKRRVHGVLAHIDVHEDKVAIEYDGTEDGLALELVEAGVSKHQILLAFKPVHIRPHTGFAAA